MQIFVIGFIGLAVLILAAVFSRRTGVAAPLLLLVLGIAAGITPVLPDVSLDPEIILAGVLPPLLYATSVQMPVVDLRRNIRMILWLSVVMVIVTALVIGALVHLAFPAIPLPLAVALGAVVSPTDAVAATSIGKRLGLPHRLMSVLEGESLFNDAAALVTLRTAVAALAASFSFWEAAGSFLWASAAGAAVGLLVGWASVAVRQRLGDPVLSTTVSFAVPWLAFFPAEELHASGIIAVVVAGILGGHRGRSRLSATERSNEATTWGAINFVFENAVFLVMGLEIARLIDDSRAEGGIERFVLLCLMVFVLMVVLRILGVGIPLLWQRLRPGKSRRVRERLSMADERLRELAEQEEIDDQNLERWHLRLDQTSADLDYAAKQPITRRGGVVLVWAGMRGVVTLAAAQTIDVAAGGQPTPYRSTIILVAFVVAVASLIIFGGTLPWVIRRLRFKTPTEGDQRAEVLSLLREMADTVVESVGPIEEQRIGDHRISAEMVQTVKKRFAPMFLGNLARQAHEGPDIRQDLFDIQQRYLEEFRIALIREQSVGAYSTQALAQVQKLLDREEQRLGRTW